LYKAIRDFALLKQDSLSVFAQRIGQWAASLPRPVHDYQWSFCGNHDIPRPMTEAGGDLSAVMLAYFLTAVLGGTLSVYYGNEIGMVGDNDPDNRRPMDWRCAQQVPEMWSFMRELIAVKRKYLHRACLTDVAVTDDGLLRICLVGAQGELTALVPSDTVSTVEGEKYECLFGDARQQDGQWVVRHFALLRKIAG
jgi:glycosidase